MTKTNTPKTSISRNAQKRWSRFRASLLFGVLVAAGACGSEKAQERLREAPETQQLAEVLDEPTEHVTSAVLPPEAPEPAPIVAEPVEPELTKFSEFMARGRTRMVSGENEGALADFERASEMRPNSQHAKVQMARTLLVLDRAGDARPYIEEAIELDGSSTLAWNTMGRVELAEGQNEAAIASFERATEEDPDNSYAWNNLGFVLIEEGRHEDAVDALEEATSGGSPRAYMWNNLGMAYEHLGDVELARASYRQAQDAGSAKAAVNFARLEGVESLVIAKADEDSAEETSADGEVTPGEIEVTREPASLEAPSEVAAVTDSE